MPEREAHLSLSRTLAEAFELYRRHWKLLAPLAVFVLLPQAILGSILGDIEVDRIESVGDVINLLTIPMFTVVALGGEALLAAIITALVREWRVGHHPPGPREFIRELPLGRLIVADLLLAVGAGLGFLLLIIPGFVFVTYFAIVPPVIELERRGFWDAFKRSASLVRGNFRRVLLLVVGATLVTEGIAGGLGFVFHELAPTFISEIAVDAVLESAQGLIVSLLAISLIRLHGDPIPEPSGRP